MSVSSFRARVESAYASFLRFWSERHTKRHRRIVVAHNSSLDTSHQLLLVGVERGITLREEHRPILLDFCRRIDLLAASFDPDLFVMYRALGQRDVSATPLTSGILENMVITCLVSKDAF